MGHLQFRYSIVAIAFAACFGVTDDAEASCQCTCINGQVRPVCTSSIDLPPICSPGICPIVPPSIKPIATPIVPPIGTRSCRLEQVMDPSTRRYEWKQVCR